MAKKYQRKVSEAQPASDELGGTVPQASENCAGGSGQSVDQKPKSRFGQPCDAAPSAPQNAIGSRNINKARMALAKMPGAVSGNNGHNQLFQAACELVRRGLNIEESLPLLQEYNKRCQPPWTDDELSHKLTDAFEQEKADPRKSQCGDPPLIYWDCKNRCYCVQNSAGKWQAESKEDAADRLVNAGLDGSHAKGELSQIYEELLRVRNDFSVDQMIGLAGYATGLHEVNGHTLLVPSSFRLIEPQKYEDGKCKHIFGILTGMLIKERPKPKEGEKVIEETAEDKTKGSEPYWCFLANLKSSYLALKAGQLTGGLAVFLCGPINSAKTLTIKHIVTKILGGRCGNSYQYITGMTSFNDELMCKEVWMIDDGVPLSDYVARKRFGGVLKQGVAAGDVPCNAKNKAQLTVPLFRRLYIAMNDDDIETLPPLAESLGDKYVLIKTKKFKMPKGCLSLPDLPARPTFEAKLDEELPFFLDWLMALDLSAWTDGRFGAVAYKDPDLEADHADSSGLDAQYVVIRESIFNKRKTDAVEMSTADIWVELMSGLSTTLATKTFRSVISLGMALSELARSKSHRQLVQKRILEGKTLWTIATDMVVEDPEGFTGGTSRSTGKGPIK